MVTFSPVTSRNEQNKSNKAVVESYQLLIK